ncbi:protein translocase subunit SecF [Homoserinibacter sp. YIM 151385]|uniref:protein translocase subunit SecF n=1 Tax=Homoserinibacter sp. YIM 151385 TaxID=2985506 RepID=UPI0022F12FCB|nr:protein translocase subunit SecF [Homoserinibacter sp. YIM 151385]WBU38677.1 protein translocase subunit SecF [Homoserinibacter sp. YIM 151385]
MAGAFAKLGNDLYTGARSVPFVGARRIWYSIAIALMLLAVATPFIRGGGDFGAGFNFGIEFRGGSQFQVLEIDTQGADSTELQDRAEEAVQSVVPNAVVRSSTLGDDAVRAQTDQLEEAEQREVRQALADEFSVDIDDVSASFIGATWGADVTGQALWGLAIFLGLAAIVLGIYFRTWKMSLAALIALAHDLVITVGVYAATGFEITPAAVIGFLTILGFSLYDTVVVFDKIRENTSEMGSESTRTFGETVNWAANQTLVRSINTGVVAALPVAAILFIGSFLLGADTLRDISLALLVGTIIGTYSTPFIAAPLYADLRHGEEEIKRGDKRTLALREKAVAA